MSQLRDLDVFIATDDITIVPQLRECPVVAENGWALHHLPGQPPRNERRSSIFRVLAELQLLVGAAFVVGTFSSNVGRLVQTLRHQPPETMTSMDGGWFIGR